jgi:hypothetical protein
VEQFYSLDGACALVPCDLPGCTGFESEYRRRYPALSLADLLELVHEGGWSPAGSDGSCRHYLHPTRSGVLTIAGKLSGEVPSLAEISLLTAAGVERRPVRRRLFGR